MAFHPSPPTTLMTPPTHIVPQWRTMGVWRPGQEVKLAPFFLIFSQKNSKMVDPKEIEVIFESEKKKKKNKPKNKKKKNKPKNKNKSKNKKKKTKKVFVSYSFMLHTKIYTHFKNYFELL